MVGMDRRAAGRLLSCYRYRYWALPLLGVTVTRREFMVVPCGGLAARHKRLPAVLPTALLVSGKKVVRERRANGERTGSADRAACLLAS